MLPSALRQSSRSSICRRFRSPSTQDPGIRAWGVVESRDPCRPSIPLRMVHKRSGRQDTDRDPLVPDHPDELQQIGGAGAANMASGGDQWGAPPATREKKAQGFPNNGGSLEQAWVSLWLIVGVAFIWLIFVVQAVRFLLQFLRLLLVYPFAPSPSIQWFPQPPRLLCFFFCKTLLQTTSLPASPSDVPPAALADPEAQPKHRRKPH